MAFDKYKFDNEEYKHYHLKVRKTQVEIINWIENQPNKNGSIIKLIEKEIENGTNNETQNSSI